MYSKTAPSGNKSKKEIFLTSCGRSFIYKKKYRLSTRVSKLGDAAEVIMDSEWALRESVMQIIMHVILSLCRRQGRPFEQYVIKLMHCFMSVSTYMPLGAQTFLAIKCIVLYCIHKRNNTCPKRIPLGRHTPHVPQRVTANTNQRHAHKLQD